MKAVQLTTAFITIAATSANEWSAPKDEVSFFLFDKPFAAPTDKSGKRQFIS